MLKSLHFDEKLRKIGETVNFVSPAHCALFYRIHRCVLLAGVVTWYTLTFGETGLLRRRTPLFEPSDAFCCRSVAFGC